MTKGAKMSRLEQAARRILPVNPIAGREQSWPIQDRLIHHGCTGVAVCVIEGGEVGEARGFGVVERDGPPVAADTMFAGASISKPLTAVLALQLVAEGRLDLDQPVNEVLESWKIPENAFTRSVPVTLRHLLSHRAGTTVHGFGDFPGERGPSPLDTLNGRAPAMTPPVLVDKTPGGGVRYSGGGTTIVEVLIEEQRGRPFAEVASSRIFEPLGMTRTTFEQPLPDRFRPFAAVGHDGEGNPRPRRVTYTPQLAAGGIYSSALDYARFMVECRRAWLGMPNVLLPQPLAWAMMECQGGGQFGLGWELFGAGSSLRFAHGGSNMGYQCNATCTLESGDGAVILTNGLMGIILHAEVLTSLAAAYGWRGIEKTPRRVVTLDAARQGTYVGRFRIVSGVDAPNLDIWLEDGKLYSKIEGMILPPREMFLDNRGRFFGQQTNAETEVLFGADGRAQELIVYAEGDVEILRAVRFA